MNLDEYLNAAKQAMNLPSDYQLAKRMGTSKQTISAYRTGAQWPDNYVVIKIAIALNLDPVRVLADLESQREKRPERAAFWRSFLSRAAVMLAMGCTLGWSSIDILPAAAAQTSGDPDNPYAKRLLIICIMSTFAIRAPGANSRPHPVDRCPVGQLASRRIPLRQLSSRGTLPADAEWPAIATSDRWSLRAGVPAGRENTRVLPDWPAPRCS